MRVLRAALAAALLATAAVSASAGPSADAAEVPAGVVAGTRLPAFPDRPHPGPLVVGTDYYVDPTRDPYAPSDVRIRRLVDNSIVRTVSDSAGLSFDGPSSVLVDPDAWSKRVTVRDVESNTLTWSFQPDLLDQVTAAAATFVVTCRDACDVLHVHRPDGSDGAVAVPAWSTPLGRSGDLLVRRTSSGEGIFTVDLSSGEVTVLPAPPGETIEEVVVQRDRIYWTSYRQDAWLHWSAPDGSGAGSVAIPETLWARGWVSVGDGLAARAWDFDAKEGALVPFDPATGQLGAPIATHLPDAFPAQAGPGSAVVVTVDSPTTGSVLVADSMTAPPRRVGGLTGPPRPVGSFALSGERVVADFNYYGRGSTVGPTWVTDVSGSSSWREGVSPESSPISGGLVSASGDVVVTKVPGWDTYRVTWPGGERTITADNEPVVGHGGQAVVRLQAGALLVEDPRTGAELARADSNVVVTQSTVWRGPTDGQITQTDLHSGALVRSVKVDPSCTSLREVLGRWAYLDCGAWLTVHDVDGVLVDQRLTEFPSAMGNGFVAFREQREDASGQPYAVLRVRDLVPGRAEHVYGPLGVGGFGTPDAAADESGARRLGYIDEGYQLRVVDLDWLATPPTAIADTRAPDLTSFTTSPRVATGSTVSATWAYSDATDVLGERPAGVRSYDVRYQQGPVGGAYGAWTQVSATTTPSLSLSPVPGVDTCFSVRARDALGNLTSWSAPKCSVRDGRAPTLTSTSGTPRVSTSTTVRFGWSFVDPAEGVGVPGSGVASYDVRVQGAQKVGGPYEAWNNRSDWQGITGTSVALTMKKGQDACFQVRARDRASRTSAWSASRCSSPDGTAPSLTSASVGPLVVPSISTSKVTFSYRATDNLGVKNYDVAYRYAASGRPLSAFVYQASWQGTTATSASLSVSPGAQVCFAVRARDVIGNVSAWSSQRCAVVPIDDRSMTTSGSTSRITSSLALGGTVTRLNGYGASVSRSVLWGDQVALVVLKGPGQGTVEVTMAKHVYGRYSLSAPTWRREVIYLSGIFFTDATLRVRSVSTAPARVDAVAARRF